MLYSGPDSPLSFFNEFFCLFESYPSRRAVVLDSLDLLSSLYRPKNPDIDMPDDGTHYGFAGFEKMFTAPYKANSALLFLKSAQSYHGVEPTPAARDTLQYQVVNPGTTFAQSRGVTA